MKEMARTMPSQMHVVAATTAWATYTVIPHFLGRQLARTVVTAWPTVVTLRVRIDHYKGFGDQSEPVGDHCGDLGFTGVTPY